MKIIVLFTGIIFLHLNLTLAFPYAKENVQNTGGVEAYMGPVASSTYTNTAQTWPAYSTASSTSYSNGNQVPSTSGTATTDLSNANWYTNNAAVANNANPGWQPPVSTATSQTSTPWTYNTNYNNGINSQTATASNSYGGYNYATAGSNSDYASSWNNGNYGTQNVGYPYNKNSGYNQGYATTGYQTNTMNNGGHTNQVAPSYQSLSTNVAGSTATSVQTTNTGLIQGNNVDYSTAASTASAYQGWSQDQSTSSTTAQSTSSAVANTAYNLEQGLTQGFSDAAPPAEEEEVYEIWHEDGSIEYIKSYEEMLRKYPDYVLLSNPEVMPQAQKFANNEAINSNTNLPITSYDTVLSASTNTLSQLQPTSNGVLVQNSLTDVTQTTSSNLPSTATPQSLTYTATAPQANAPITSYDTVLSAPTNTLSQLQPISNGVLVQNRLTDVTTTSRNLPSTATPQSLPYTATAPQANAPITASSIAQAPVSRTVEYPKPTNNNDNLSYPIKPKAENIGSSSSSPPTIKSSETNYNSNKKETMLTNTDASTTPIENAHKQTTQPASIFSTERPLKGDSLTNTSILQSPPEKIFTGNNNKFGGTVKPTQSNVNTNSYLSNSKQPTPHPYDKVPVTQTSSLNSDDATLINKLDKTETHLPDLGTKTPKEINDNLKNTSPIKEKKPITDIDNKTNTIPPTTITSCNLSENQNNDSVTLTPTEQKSKTDENVLPYTENKEIRKNVDTIVSSDLSDKSEVNKQNDNFMTPTMPTNSNISENKKKKSMISTPTGENSKTSDENILPHTTNKIIEKNVNTIDSSDSSDQSVSVWETDVDTNEFGINHELDTLEKEFIEFAKNNPNISTYETDEQTDEHANQSESDETRKNSSSKESKQDTIASDQDLIQNKTQEHLKNNDKNLSNGSEESKENTIALIQNSKDEKDQKDKIVTNSSITKSQEDKINSGQNSNNGESKTQSKENKIEKELDNNKENLLDSSTKEPIIDDVTASDQGLKEEQLSDSTTKKIENKTKGEFDKNESLTNKITKKYITSVSQDLNDQNLTDYSIENMDTKVLNKEESKEEKNATSQGESDIENEESKTEEKLDKKDQHFNRSTKISEMDSVSKSLIDNLSEENGKDTNSTGNSLTQAKPDENDKNLFSKKVEISKDDTNEYEITQEDIKTKTEDLTSRSTDKFKVESPSETQIKNAEEINDKNSIETADSMIPDESKKNENLTSQKTLREEEIQSQPHKEKINESGKLTSSSTAKSVKDSASETQTENVEELKHENENKSLSSQAEEEIQTESKNLASSSKDKFDKKSSYKSQLENAEEVNGKDTNEIGETEKLDESFNGTEKSQGDTSESVIEQRKTSTGDPNFTSGPTLIDNAGEEKGKEEDNKNLNNTNMEHSEGGKNESGISQKETKPKSENLSSSSTDKPEMDSISETQIENIEEVNDYKTNESQSQQKEIPTKFDNLNTTNTDENSNETSVNKIKEEEIKTKSENLSSDSTDESEIGTTSETQIENSEEDDINESTHPDNVSTELESTSSSEKSEFENESNNSESIKKNLSDVTSKSSEIETVTSENENIIFVESKTNESDNKLEKNNKVEKSGVEDQVTDGTKISEVVANGEADTSELEVAEEADEDTDVTVDQIIEVLQNFSGKEPLVWFKTSDTEVLQKLLNEDGWDYIYFFNIKSSEENTT